MPFLIISSQLLRTQAMKSEEPSSSRTLGSRALETGKRSNFITSEHQAEEHRTGPVGAQKLVHVADSNITARSPVVNRPQLSQ